MSNLFKLAVQNNRLANKIITPLLNIIYCESIKMMNFRESYICIQDYKRHSCCELQVVDIIENVHM